MYNLQVFEDKKTAFLTLPEAKNTFCTIWRGGKKVLIAEGLVLSAKKRKWPKLALTYEAVIKLSAEVMKSLRKSWGRSQKVRRSWRSHRKSVEAGGKRQENFRKRPGNAARRKKTSSISKYDTFLGKVKLGEDSAECEVRRKKLSAVSFQREREDGAASCILPDHKTRELKIEDLQFKNGRRWAETSRQASFIYFVKI
jgi:hypothetical protein